MNTIYFFAVNKETRDFYKNRKDKEKKRAVDRNDQTETETVTNAETSGTTLLPRPYEENEDFYKDRLDKGKGKAVGQNDQSGTDIGVITLFSTTEHN